MIAVVLSHPNGRRDPRWLAGVPRVGEQIRLFDGSELTVEHVLWQEAIRDQDANVIIVVHPTTPIPEPR